MSVEGRECGCGKPVSAPSNLPFGSWQQRQDDREGKELAGRSGVPRSGGRRCARCQGRGPHAGSRRPRRAGLGRIGIEAQIENAQGLTNIDAIAAGPRVQALVLGPADMAASLNMRTLEVGEQPEGYDVGDAHHHVLMRILIAARAHGVLAIDGPYLKIRDVDGFRRVAGRSAALGYDGKWVLHPDQIAAGNEVFSPRQTDYDHAELILEAYEWHTSRAGGARGAAMLGDEMIDEASRKMALVIAGKGRAARIARGGDP